MSQISDRHTVATFLKGEKLKALGAPGEQRILSVRFNDRTDKKTGKKLPPEFPNAWASVPEISPDFVKGRDSEVWPILKGSLEKLQDEIFAERWVNSRGTLSSIGDADISLDAILSFYAAKNEGERLSEKRISSWFANCVSENLTVVLAEAKGKSTDDPQIHLFVQNMGKICELLATDARLSERQEEHIRYCLKVADSSVTGDVMERKLVEKTKPARQELELPDLPQ